MKKSRPVFEKNIFQKMEVNLNFRGLGEISTCQNFKKIQASSTLCVVQIWWRCDFEHIPLFAKNRFSHRPQWKRRLITCPLSAGKSLTTESVDVGSYTPQHSAYSESVRRRRVRGGTGRARPVRPDAGPKRPVVDRSTSRSQNDVSLHDFPRHVTFPAI